MFILNRACPSTHALGIALMGILMHPILRGRQS